MGMNATRPTLVLSPVADAEFTRFAEAELDVSDTPEQLQALLRARYPDAVVHARELSDERLLVWYVYRDGHWVSG
jgi:hypothetical protein